MRGSGGLNGQVYALAVSGSNVYVGGHFDSAVQSNGTSIAVNGIARWDGAQWHGLKSGVGGSPNVGAIAISGANVYIGGHFTSVSGVSTDSIARWDGTNWNGVGGGVTTGFSHDPGGVAALAMVGSKLYVGGSFDTAGTGPSAIGASRIAEWDGSSWHALSSGVTNNPGSDCQVYALAASGAQLYVGGRFAAAGGKANTTAFSGANVYVGGAFDSIDGVTARNIAVWNGTSWSALGGGTDGPVEALLPYAGYLYAGGHFSQAGAISGLTTPLARWNLASSPSSTAGWGAMSNNTSRSPKLSNDVTALAATSMPYGGQAGPRIVAGGSIQRYNPGGTYCLNSASEDRRSARAA